ncbi:MAG: HNH endonuclease signature motif containing protein [Methanomicrobiales archaeon]
MVKCREKGFYPPDDGRDKQRIFTNVQQKEILYQQNNLCAGEYCKYKPLDLRIVQYHHAEGWAARGRTKIQNGIAVCPNCHALIHYYEKLEIQERDEDENGGDVEEDRDPMAQV